MSRVAKNPIAVPAQVSVTFAADVLRVKGDRGTQELRVHPSVCLAVEDGVIRVAPRNGDRSSDALAGTTRSLVNNLVIGVSSGFEKRLQLVGVGYRVQVQGRLIGLSLGFSHPVEYQLPDGVSAEAPTQTELILRSADKQLLGQVAAEIRAFRPPEPYKGKGVRYTDEQVHRKEAKKK